tara:strand:- start:414 stop:857 length:444 start_codon:yes stop_codon:yes gene_type:complete
MTQRYTEEDWIAHYDRMNNFMGTKSDRNTPFEKLQSTPEYQFHTEAADDNRSLRYNNGKPDYSLIPLASMQEAAKVLEYGATKYARDNWKRPTHWTVSFACLQRHLAAWQSGEDNDPESGRNHLGHAMCNILQMLHMLENHPEELER